MPTVVEALLRLGTLPSIEDRQVKLLAPLLAHIESDLGHMMWQRLSWVLELSEVLRLNECKARDDAASALYELLNHTVVPTDSSMEAVYETLRHNAEACRADITPSVAAFFVTAGCAQLLASLRLLAADDSTLWTLTKTAEHHASVQAALAHLPLTDVVKHGLLRTIKTLALHEAVCVVDVCAAGLPVVFVNAPWEELTGFAQEEVVAGRAQLPAAAGVGHRGGGRRTDGARGSHSERVHRVREQLPEGRHALPQPPLAPPAH
jgi:hypothetical protein